MSLKNRDCPRRGLSLFLCLLIILSSILLIISFPSFNLWLFAWIGLLPLFFALDGQKPFNAFLIAYLTGVLFFFGTVYWLVHVTLPGMIAVVLYLAVYFGIFGLLASFAIARPSYISLFSIPAIWVALEYTRSHFMGGFGWNLLAHSQSANLLMIQIADVTGAYGVSFLVVMVNVALFFTIKDIRAKIMVQMPEEFCHCEEGKARRSNPFLRLLRPHFVQPRNDDEISLMAGLLRKRSYPTFYLAAALVFVFLASGYGTLRLNNIFTGERIKVAVVQGNIAQDKKWDSAFRKEIMDKYEALTLGALKEGPDIIIWPETSVPGFLHSERDLSGRVMALAKNAHAALLVGSPRQDAEDEDVYYNCAALFDKDGKALANYDKLHLVPFGEFIPAKELFSFVEKFTKSTIGDFSPGEEYTVFKFLVEKKETSGDYRRKLLKKVKFSTLICFEDIFPELARQFVKNGANFLVNITNDAWFAISSAPYQHVQSSVFRAVENRVNVIRAANTGISCFIDQKGKVFGIVAYGGKDIFVDGYKTEDIVLTPTRTFYTIYGDLFAYLCILVAGIYMVLTSRQS